MEHFLINSTACLFALWLFYKIALENTSWHLFKRYYLIGSIILSITIPFIVVETLVIPVQEFPFTNSYSNNSGISIAQEIIQEPEFTVNWFYVWLLIYCIGFSVMLWRFVKNMYSFRILKDDQLSSYKTYELVLRNSFTIPHSFLKRIFLSKEEYESNQIPLVVLEHEKAHLDQKHSLDILFIELLIVLLWFNPLLYIIRYSIKLNHEFLADQTVLNQGVSTSDYQQTLLDHATTNYQQAMANTFTFPIIKKRFHIMKTHTSNTSLVFRSLALIPVIALLVISCGKEKTEYQDTTADSKFNETIKSEMSGSIKTEDGTDYYFKTLDNDKMLYFDQQGNLLKDFDINAQNIDVFTMFPKKGQNQDNTNSPTLELIENSKEELKYFINDYEVTKTEAVQTIKNTGEKGVIIDVDENGKSAIKITMTAEKRKKMPQIGSMKLESGAIASFSPTLINPDKNKDNKLYQMKKQIVSVAEMQEKPTKFYIDNEQVTKSEIHYLLHDNPDAGISIKDNNDSSKSLHFTSKKESISNEQLQEIYSQLFKDDKLGALRTSEKEHATSNSDVQVTNEPDSEDFYYRKSILMASFNLNKKPNYQLNGKSATLTAIQKYLVDNESANMTYTEGAQNTLNFSDHIGKKMTLLEIRDIAEVMAKNGPKETPTTFVAINETSWKVVTVDATVRKGAFERKGANYTYDSSDLNQIKIFDNKGQLLNETAYKNLAVGFSVIWWQGEQKYRELIKQPEIIEGMKNGTFAVFYVGGYTKDYEEALKLDASNTFLSMGSTLEGKTINMQPHSWAYTNPSLQQFQKYLEK
ncbi:M56 family metallopeptidase [Nonlabens sp. Ci31]|uniref:M56 family metallopeptidase n=1 Tax=Nonlabens sp. Ci31 TaxID=2608253 RepID=UPI0014640DB0|nr:M56 family metallopeptidase [Nonlabens sp. Ci31]QJP34189.1 M56 family metallopeptidase [Nonlabens sp. Ci31]